jgi:histidinol dehydrogenase
MEKVPIGRAPRRGRASSSDFFGLEIGALSFIESYMRLIDLREFPNEAWRKELDRRYQPDTPLITQVANILDAVRTRGDSALSEFAKKFDRTDLIPKAFRVTDAEIEEADGHLDPLFEEALEAAYTNVREFAQRSRRTDWIAENVQGARVGERFDPFERVGIYVPAGTAPLVSSAIMTVTLANAVNVPEIVVTSPVGPDKKTNPALLSALHLAGATEIYKIGGAQAIGALAFGTDTIRPVTKIFGPGNAYVTEAKRQVFGYVAIDLLPGPSEIIVLADETANPAWVASDLLAQAEHGHGSWIGLVTTTLEFAVAVRKEIETQLLQLTRQSYLRDVLENHTLMVVTRDIQEAVTVVNAFAPEHLSLITQAPESIAKKITTAGAIFIGGYSPVAAGDFVAGPSHTLPTGGAGKSFGGLTVDQFQRRTSIIEYDKESLAQSRAYIERFSQTEQLDAHGRSASIRFENEVGEG